MRRKPLPYERLSDAERFAAVLAAADRGDLAEADRLMLMSPFTVCEQHGAGTLELLEAARACCMLFLCEWHQALGWYTRGMLAGGLHARRLQGENTPRQRAATLRRLALLDDLQHRGECRIVALIVAWEEFCGAEGLDGPAVLRLLLGEVAEEVERLRMELFDGWVRSARESGTAPGQDARRLLAEFRGRWPASQKA